MLTKKYHFTFFAFLLFTKSIQCVEPAEFRPLEEELISAYESEDDDDYADEYPLHQAADAGNLERVIELLEQGEDPHQKAEDGEEPLAAAAGAERNSYAVTKYLLDNIEDIDINAQDDEGFTALHEAVWEENIATAKLLLERGADPAIMPYEIKVDVNEIIEIFSNYLNSLDSDALGKLDINPDMIQNNPPAAMKNLVLYEGLHTILGSIGYQKFVSPLHAAVIKNSPELTKLILEAGIDPDIGKDKRQSLVLEGQPPEEFEGFVAELDRSIRINRDAAPQTPLRLAINIFDEEGKPAVSKEIVKMLVHYGADPDRQDDSGYTYLMHLALHGQDEDKDLYFVKALLDAGADPNFQTTRGLTATLLRQPKLVKLLLSYGADPNRQDDSGYTYLMHLALQGQDEDKDLYFVKALLDAGADPNFQTKGGRTAALHIAAAMRQPKLVKLLLEHRGYPNVYDQNGNTPLHFVVSPIEEASTLVGLIFPSSFPQEATSLTDQAKTIINLLLKNKANAGYKNLYFQTPLHFAAGWNNLEALELLVDHLKNTDNLAILNYQDRHLLEGDVPGSNTALHYAVMNQNLPMVQTLVAAGADINKQNHEGNTPLNVALKVPAGIKMMTDEQIEITKLLIGEGALLTPNNAGESPLITGFQQLDEEGVIQLINRANDVTIQTRDTGRTLLHLLARSRFIFEEDADIEFVVDRLLSKGADINAQDNDGNTPLHLAVLLFQDLNLMRRVVLQFLVAGAMRDIANVDGKTPLDIAQGWNLDEIAELLQSEFEAG